MRRNTKIFTVLLFSFCLSSFAQKKKPSPLKFLKTEAIKSNKSYKYNKYEDIINGSIAFVIGNIGYYTTDSQSLKLSYSGVQTIGILNVGKGIYDYYRPIQDKELYLMLKNSKGQNKEALANQMIRIFAKEERAKRMQLLWGSTLLATQYFINAFSSETEQELKEIYQFLGGVNLIVIGYSYFYKQKYEKYYYSKSSYSFSPALFKVPLFEKKRKSKDIAGINFSYKF